MNTDAHHLVVETQYATDLTLSGLRRLCAVPTGEGAFGRDNDYALHVGLYSYCAGLERLCKLAIACHGFTTGGTFPKLKGYSHKISRLLDAVEALDLAPLGGATWNEQYTSRPTVDLDPELTEFVERFAGGAGRYEHLDSLWDAAAQVSTVADWAQLSARSSVSPEITRLLSLRLGVHEAVSDALIEAELETSGSQVVDALGTPMFPPSVGVVMSLFRNVRWVSAVLDCTTYYAHQKLPILGEVVSRAFVHPSRDFFAWQIAQFADEEVVAEELEDVLPRLRAKQATFDAEDGVDPSE